MEIKTVSIIGLGALGILFGHHLSRHIPKNELRIIADRERIEKYLSEKLYCNEDLCDFTFFEPEQKCAPADLLIFSVKFNGLDNAIELVKNQVGPNTIIMSLLNGISSEEIIGRAFGMEKILYTVAQGMDAVKIGNKLTYKNMGMICFGDLITTRPPSDKAKSVMRFFDKVKLPYEFDFNMKKRIWGKFMLNVGVNQAVAVFECDYGGILKTGHARETMISAMKEVLLLSNKEDVGLTQADLEYWLSVLDGLSPEGKPSMRQDIEAGRLSEVDLFSGTVLSLAKKHNLPCPTNQMLYDRIKLMESKFDLT